MVVKKRIGVVGVPGGWSSEALADAVAERTGYRLLIDMGKVCVDLASGRAMFEGTALNELDGLIIKKVGALYTPGLIDRLELLRFLNERGLPVLSKPISVIRLLDRLSCTVSLRTNGIPMPETTITEDIDEALAALYRYGQAVFKPLFSSKARGMTVIGRGDTARAQVRKFREDGNTVIYLQKMVKHPGADMGIAFLGGEYLGAYARRSAGGSWNTTIHNGGMYQPYEPSSEIIAMAHKAQEAFDIDFTCVDVVETPDGPLVFEVSAFGGFRGLRDAQGIDVAAAYTDYVLRKVNHD